METLTINRGEWLTGAAQHALGESKLRHRYTGLKCCLGFYGEACGLGINDINGVGTLATLFDRHSIELAQASWLVKALDEKDQKRFGSEVNVQWALVRSNDGKLHPTRRESAIKYLFHKYGDIDVTFTGRYAEGTKTARDYDKR